MSSVWRAFSAIHPDADNIRDRFYACPFIIPRIKWNFLIYNGISRR